MPEIKISTTTMETAKLAVAGRCKLFGISVSTFEASTTSTDTIWNSSTNIEADTATLDKISVILSDGSATGDVKFKYSLPVGMRSTLGGCGATPFPFMFGDKYILFKDGIYLKNTWSTSPGNNLPYGDKSLVYLYYEGA